MTLSMGAIAVVVIIAFILGLLSPLLFMIFVVARADV